MNILEIIVVVGFASAYLVELIALPFRRWVSSRWLGNLLTPGVVLWGIVALGYKDFEGLFAGLAACFVSTSVRVLLDVVTSKPQVVSNYRRY